MKLLYFILLLTPSCAYSGELLDRFRHQEIINGGFKDPLWKDRKPERQQKNKEIGFEKAVSCRMCPSYSLIIEEDGSFTYTGLYMSDIRGIITGKIPRKTLDKLFKYIETINYFSLNNRYSYPRTHASRVYTYVKLGSKYKVIENYMNQAPASVWALELMFDSLVTTHVYKKGVRPVTSWSILHRRYMKYHN